MNYKYIWAWEILKGTTSADIVRGIVSLAREENAPVRAIMRLHDGRWLTLEDLSNEELVQQIENEAKKHDITSNHHNPIPYPYICQNLVLVLVVLKGYINLI